MKFLKQKTISKYSPSDLTMFTNQFGRAVMNLTGGLRLPQGTTAQRPQTTGVRYPASGVTGSTEYADGMIRYNTTTNTLECLIAGVWEVVRAPGATAISKQTIGPGDSLLSSDGEFLFGPLSSVPAGTSYLASADNILVLVENVMQISTTNYEIVQNPCAVSGTSISFDSATKRISSASINFASDKFRAGQTITVTGSALNDGTYTIAADTDGNPLPPYSSVTSTYITVVEALTTEAAGATVTITGNSSATGYLGGAAYTSGYYLWFSEAVPNGKYVTVYYGYAN